MGKFIDLTGQRFGRLTVIKRDINRKGQQAFWICQCDCGNEKSIGSSQLRSGTTQSCGCKKKEFLISYDKTRKKDLTGQRFGRLTVIKECLERDAWGSIKWECQCDCGNITQIRGSSLVSGNTQSCGTCSHISFGEQKIKELLEKHNIYYQYQKTFEDCKYPNTGKHPPFDFYVDNRYIIEFDGKQHFESTGGWNTDDQVKITQNHDQYKEQWCKNHNIPLLRIPYTKLETLTFDDIWINNDEVFK